MSADSVGGVVGGVGDQGYAPQLSSVKGSRDWYNEGIKALKDQEIAQGILCLERAMLTEPSNATIREALSLAYSSSVGVQSAQVSVPTSPLDGLCYLFSIPVWIGVALVGFALSLVSFVCYRFAYSMGRQKAFFSASLAFLGLCLLSNACIAHQLYYHKEREHRLIVTTSSPIYPEPTADDSQSLQVLPVGVPLELESIEGEWCRVRLSSMPSAVWIPRTFVEPVELSVAKLSATRN